MSEDFSLPNFESKLTELCNSMVCNSINDFLCCKEIKKTTLFHLVYLYIHVCEISVVFTSKG